MAIAVDVIAKVTKQLASARDAETKRRACSTLKGWAFDDENFQALRNAGAIPAFVKALREGSSSPVTQFAVDAIWSLSSDKINHTHIVAAGALPILAQLLFSRDKERVVHSAASALVNMVDLETGPPAEISSALLAAGGVDALVGLLPEGDEIYQASDAHQAVTATLAAIAVNFDIGEALVAVPGAVERLVHILRAGARAEAARHAAATLARLAHNSAAGQAAVREAGGIPLLIELCDDALDTWALSDEDCQAAQHAAGALWILSDEPQSKVQIRDSPGALKLLASLLGGRCGHKAEGNAAGALLALGLPCSPADPVSVLTPTWKRREIA